jgi:type III secretory pathway component EscS
MDDLDVLISAFGAFLALAFLLAFPVILVAKVIGVF